MYRALCIVLLAALSTATRLPFRKNSVPFILNGDDADEGEWPHQCSFQSNSGFHFCGAVYIGNGWLSTAAHCADGETPNSARAVCGVTSLSDSDDATEFGLSQIIEHPDYNFFTLENDHAILELTEIPDGANIVAVFADDVGGDAWVGAECWITGWGQDDTGGSPDRLQEAQVLALSQADCEDFYAGTGYDIYDDMICVGHDNDDYTGACYGDSGGPFVCRQSADEAWTLIGVTSWAYPPCGADFYPSVYSRTAYFREWISDNCGGCI